MSFVVKITDAEGATCSADLGITIASGVTINWNNLVWDYVYGTGGDLASVSAAGDFFDFDLQANGSTTAFAAFHSSMMFTGPLQHCMMTLTVTAVSGGFTYFSCQVMQDGVQVFLEENSETLGVHTFTFDVAAGTNSLIEVFVQDLTYPPVTASILAAAPDGVFAGSVTFS